MNGFECLLVLLYDLALCIDETQGGVNVVQLPLHQLLSLSPLHPLLRVVAALQHRRNSLDGHLRIREILLLSGVIEKVLCKPLEVFEGEIAEPLEVLLAQQAALLLLVFLLVELGISVGLYSSLWAALQMTSLQRS